MIGWILFAFAVGFIIPLLLHAKRRNSNDLFTNKFTIEKFLDSDILIDDIEFSKFK